MSSITPEQASKIIRSYFKYNHPLRCQEEAFLFFKREIIPIIFLNEIIVLEDDKIKIIDVELTDSKHTSSECLNNKLTYSGNILIKVSNTNGDITSIDIGRIPLMVIGEEMSGYFIIDGQRKNVIMEEKIRFNMPFVLSRKKKNPKFSSCVEIKSMSKLLKSTMLSLGMINEKHDTIMIYSPELSIDFLPFGIFINMYLTRDEIIQFIVDHEGIEFYKKNFAMIVKNLDADYSLQQWDKVYFKRRKDKTELVSKKIQLDSLTNPSELADLLLDKKYEIIDSILLHIEDKNKRVYYIVSLFCMYLKYLSGDLKSTDRDHYGRKIVYSICHFFTSQLSHMFQKFKYLIAKKKYSFLITNVSNIITGGMTTCLTNNSWHGKKDQNVSRQFEPYNWYCYLSSSRVVETPVKNETNRITEPRELHCTQFKILCPYETPDGKKVGLKKHLSCGCMVSYNQCKELKQVILRNIGNYLHDRYKYLVLVNGNWIGCTYDFNVISDRVKTLRRSGAISIQTSISFIENVILISDEIGRLLFPVLNVIRFNEFKEFSSFEDMLSKGAVELIDKLEEENMVIKCEDIFSNINDGYCNLLTFLLHGYNANRIPFSNHNQSPRNLYQCQMAKHVMAGDIYHCSQLNVLNYPQIPLVPTVLDQIKEIYEHPSGVNCKVVIMPFMGQNQEDSIVFNRASIERGLLSSTRYYTVYHKIPLTCEMYKPTHSLGGLNFSKLGDNGIIAIDGKREVTIVKNDVIISVKVVEGNEKVFSKLQSYIYKDDATAHITHVDSTIVTEKGEREVKIIYYILLFPEIGDKFSCFDPETEILTNEGFITFEKLTFDHKVGSITNDFELEYTNPTDIQSYDYEGNMYSLETNLISLLVTPNHNLFVSDYSGLYHFQRADELIGKVMTYRKHVDSILTNEDIRIEGINNWIITYGNWIRTNLESFMKLDEFVWKLNTKQCRLLLDLLPKQFNAHIKLADDIQRLAIHAGWCVSIDGSKVNFISSSEVTVNYERIDDQWVQYKGKVYCCTVPSHKVIIRRNKKVVITGQSTCAQKSTVGMIYPMEDLPFDSNGIAPDIIINPQCIPSRRTIGYMLEMITGNEISSMSANKYCKICAEYKKTLKERCEFDCILSQTVKNYLYITPFYDELIPKHFKDINGEIFYNGMTGEMFKGLVFTGELYYQRLKHLSSDKLYSRTTGPLQAVTRQPREGRSVDGGHRFGTMERDNAGSHGVMSILKERLFDQSDRTIIKRCRKCGIFDHTRPSDISFNNRCKLCGEDTIVSSEIPFGTKAFAQLVSIYNTKLEFLS